MSCPFGFSANSSGKEGILPDSSLLGQAQSTVSDLLSKDIGVTSDHPRGTEPKPTYTSYLGLDLVLSAQFPRSRAAGDEHHDEMLFIVIHQTYELWFLQVLHDLDSVLEIFCGPTVDCSKLILAEQRLGRIMEIFKILADQFRVLLTMSPDQFLSFRKFLGTSSGFQSLQFRMLELKLGLKDEARTAHGSTFREALGPLSSELTSRTQGCPDGGGSLVQTVDAWLARTPFVKHGAFDWWQEYQTAALAMFDEDADNVSDDTSLNAAERDAAQARTAKSRATFTAVFKEDEYNTQGRRLSHGAFKAALLINLYHDEPMMQVPWQVLRRLVEVDEGLAMWRWRHADMVKRMLGTKIGTGGSGGHEYLAGTTSQKYRIFSDLADVSAYMLPRERLPQLPKSVSMAMSFVHSNDVASEHKRSAAASLDADADESTQAKKRGCPRRDV